MKKIFLSLALACLVMFPSFSQNKKAVRDSLAVIEFNKAAAAIEAKDFVIIVDTYDTGDGNYEINTDNTIFLSYEKEFAYLQGQLIAGNGYTNKLNVTEFESATDKKGNIRVTMQVRGFYITARIEISLRKPGNNADVIITPTKGPVKRFTGQVIPKAESRYFRRSGEI